MGGSELFTDRSFRICWRAGTRQACRPSFNSRSHLATFPPAPAHVWHPSLQRPITFGNLSSNARSRPAQGAGRRRTFSHPTPTPDLSTRIFIAAAGTHLRTLNPGSEKETAQRKRVSASSARRARKGRPAVVRSLTQARQLHFRRGYSSARLMLPCAPRIRAAKRNLRSGNEYPRRRHDVRARGGPPSYVLSPKSGSCTFDAHNLYRGGYSPGRPVYRAPEGIAAETGGAFRESISQAGRVWPGPHAPEYTKSTRSGVTSSRPAPESWTKLRPPPRHRPPVPPQGSVSGPRVA
ncbi:hypothetical protein FBY30_2150 [Arthrobacter sp. SLBN-83]|nr:hypothetical protein FBY30_2150 [Arthrobacter sp. SLBN-83]